MTALNEHDQQLLETLLNQADAVSPGTENGQHTEHRGFHSPDHDFQLLDRYINSDIGEDMEPMQFEQQPASSQQNNTSYQPQGASSGYSSQQQASGTAYNSQQQASGTAYNSQQQASSSGYSGQPQTSTSGYSSQQQVATSGYTAQQSAGSGYGSQQQSATSAYGTQQQASASHPPKPSDASFQNQGAAVFGGQQGGYSSVAAVQSPVQMEQGNTGNYQVQSQNYQQIQTPSQGNLSNTENYQAHSSSGFDQQYSGGQSNPSASASASYVNQPTSFTQQYSVDSASAQNSTGSSSGAGYQSQVPAFQSQSIQQQGSIATGHTDQFNQNPDSYQQQQQTSYQQGSNQSISDVEQSYQSGCADGTSVHYQSGFTQQPAQQQQTAYSQGASSVHPNHQGNLGSGFAQQQQQQTSFQNASPAPSQVDQSGTAGSYPGQVPKYPNQQSFHSPVGSPCQADRSVPPSPSGYPQPSPDYGSKQVATGTGYPSGNMPTFQKQQSFHSPVPSPAQSQLDQSVTATPGSYQQPSQGFGSQTQMVYQGTVKSPSAEEQTAGGNYSAQTAYPSAAQQTAFSPSPGEPAACSNFQGGSSFHQKVPDQTDNTFQAQSASDFTRQFSAQGDQNLPGTYQAQASDFQQQAFQTPAQSVGHGEHQPMEDGSENMSIEETLKAQPTVQQDQGMYESQYQTGTPSPYQSTPTSQYQAAPVSQYQASPAPVSQYQTTPTSPYQAVPTTQYQQVQTSQYQVPSSSQFQPVQTSQYLQTPVSQCQLAPVSQYQATPTSQFQTAPTSQYQQVPTTQHQQPPTSYAQRDQPMDVQASPGNSGNTGVFQGYAASSVHSNVFNATASEAAAAAGSGSGYLNQALAFQSHSSAYPAASSLTAQSVTNVVHDQISTVSSAPSGQLGPGSSGSQATSDTGFVFSESSSGQQLQHQRQQPQFQQHVQQGVIGQTPQTGSVTLVRNSSSHAISGLICDGSPFQGAISSAGQAAVQQPAKFGVDHFSHQAVGITPGSQSLQIPVQASSGNQAASSFQASVPTLTMGASGIISQQSVTPQIPVSSGTEKSSVASVIDSSQANAALNLLASLLSNKSLLQGLQGLQALLPPNTQTAVIGQLPTATPAAAAAPAPGSLSGQQNTLPHGTDGDPNLLAKFLQTHLQQGGQQGAQLQKPAQQPQQVQSQHQQVGQVHHQAQTFQVPTHQQPNFLIQQPSQQPGFVAVHQHPLPTHHNKPQQQQVVEIPASALGSLGGNLKNLETLGVSISSDGQLMIGQQGLKIVLQPNTVTSTASTSSGTQAPPLMAQSTGLPSVPLTTLSGQAELSQVLHSNIKLPAGFILPSDLQNISVQPFISAAHSLAATGTQASVAVTCSALHVETSISSHTTVTPTSSFVHPVPTAGVGLSGKALPYTSSIPSSTSDTLTFLTSNHDQSAVQSVQNLTVSASGPAGTPNIFYPVSTVGTFAKAGEATSSSVVTPVRNFLNVTTGSASSLLNAFKMAAADGSSCGFSPAPASASESIFSDGTKPMDTNQGGVKMDSLEMEVSDPVVSSPNRPMEMDRPVLDLTSRHSSRKSSMEDDEQRGEGNSMLRRILTMKDEDAGGTAAASEMLLESPTSEHSPVDLSADHPEMFIDGNTQATLIEKSERLQLEPDVQQEDNFQWTFPSGPSTPVEEVVPSKVHKGLDDLDASSGQVSVPSVEKLFDAGGASSCSSYVFTKFGADVTNSVFTFGNSKSTTVSTTTTDTRTSSIVSKPDAARATTVPTASIRPSSRKQKDPGLTFQFPSKVGEYELRILTQPEEQHRARYLTEGSRGAVKDRSQQGYPVIKLLGYNEPATLQIFIGNETGRVKPHGFYQACKVCGKNSTQCSEREIDGTNVIEIEISPVNDMQVSMDCVGILKLRNADVEKRIGTSKAKAHKKNSTKARLVFRVTLQKPDGSYFTLQTVSSPILCTQPIGQPEISRMSLSELCVNQTSDLFIIGKNFLKGTQILFQELGPDNIEVIWQSEAEIETEYFQQTHLICRVPPYRKKELDSAVHVQIVAFSGGKTSEPQEFIYKPAMVMVKEEDPMETEMAATSKSLPFGVSPVALHLNRLVERTQHHSTSTSLFQLPPGAVPSIGAVTTMTSAPKVVSSNTAQPVSSVLKPAALTLPTGGQPVFPVTTGLGSQKSVPAGVPVQFVLPPLGAGHTVTLERPLGTQTPQFLVMNPQSTADTQQTVFTSDGQPATSGVHTVSIAPVSSSITIGTTASGSSQSAALGQVPGSSAPMIVILTGPPSTAAPGTAFSSSTGNNNSNNIVPLSVHQPSSSGQVESLLKQILEAPKPSSS